MSAFRYAMGSAGPGKQWRHIVEQRYQSQFGAAAIHNTQNVIAIDAKLHGRISALYSRINERVTGSGVLTVRRWLDGHSFATQRRFGLKAIRNALKGIW